MTTPQTRDRLILRPVSMAESMWRAVTVAAARETERTGKRVSAAQWVRDAIAARLRRERRAGE